MDGTQAIIACCGIGKPTQSDQKWAIYPLLIACLLNFSKKLAFKKK